MGRARPSHPAGSTEVEITLIPDGGKTRVRLVHRGLPDDAVLDHTHGWDHYLDRLAVVSPVAMPDRTVAPDDGSAELDEYPREGHPRSCRPRSGRRRASDCW